MLTERYLTFVGQIEQFNDIRRTKNSLGIPPIKGTTIPQTFILRAGRININPNTPKLASAGLFKATTIATTAY